MTGSRLSTCSACAGALPLVRTLLPSPCAICARRCARRQIYSQLQQLTFATKQQRTQAVEMIKQISELMVFADKHADALFECVPCPHP